MLVVLVIIMVVAFLELRSRTEPERKDNVVVLLCCVDYRLTQPTYSLMKGHQYDVIAMPGASLAPQQGAFPGWARTFFEQLAVCRDLHAVTEVVIVDHTDCGAFKHFTDETHVDRARLLVDPEYEIAVHTFYMRRLAELIRNEYPDITVRGHLLRPAKRKGGYD